ncbi:DUF362 domain-containing protein [bacterium]|nr:DUF362 domain-containing protein [bacterium]
MDKNLITGIAGSRRRFIKSMMAGAAGLTAGFPFPDGKSEAATVEPGTSRVSFVTGTDRRDMIYQALKPLEKEIKQAIGEKQVIIKPNNVYDSVPLCATHPDSMRGVLDFLKPFYKKQVIIAESTTSPKGTLFTFEQYKYFPLESEYGVKFTDFNRDIPTTLTWILDKELHPVGIRVIDTFLDPNVYFISVTRLKSHDMVVATLSTKNMVMASPVNKAPGDNDKPKVHQGIKGINWNLFQLARTIRPQLAVLDGIEGMEGNGPVGGTPVDHGVALASTDFIAADRIGVELMGIDIGDVGYLTYCINAGYGQGNRSKIEIIGPDPSKYVRKYRLHDTIEEQLTWKKTG